MLTAYERRLILQYLANAASRLHHRDPEARELVGWITENDRRTASGRRRGTLGAPGGKGKWSRALPASARLGRKRLDLDDFLGPEELRELADCMDGPTGKQ